MNITVKLFGNLRRYLPPAQEAFELAVPAGITVATVIQQLGVHEGEIGLAVVNGELVEEATALSDGDRLELFAVMGGGQSLIAIAAC